MDDEYSTQNGHIARTIEVTLRTYEVEIGRYVGRKRHESATARGLRDRLHEPDDGLKCHEAGAIAELAVARALDRYWPASVDTFSLGADVSSWIQVRWTRHANGHLIVHSNDHLRHAYVLTTGEAPNLSLRGWIFGATALLNHPGRANGDRWIRQADLLPMDTLKGAPR